MANTRPRTTVSESLLNTLFNTFDLNGGFWNPTAFGTNQGVLKTRFDCEIPREAPDGKHSSAHCGQRKPAKRAFQHP